MPIPPANDESRQPQQRTAEVEKLYESCCGSCGSPSPTTPGLTLVDLTTITKGTDSGAATP